jgi:hypothetical protein
MNKLQKIKNYTFFHFETFQQGQIDIKVKNRLKFTTFATEKET